MFYMDTTMEIYTLYYIINFGGCGNVRGNVNPGYATPVLYGPDYNHL